MTLQLEVGGRYLNRRGEVVTITHTDDVAPGYPFRGDDGDAYAPNGQWLRGDKLNVYDLISVAP